MTGEIVKKYYYIAIKKIDKKNLSEAIPILEKVVLLDAVHLDGLNLLGLCFYQLGAFDKAEECWMKSINKSQDNNEAKRYMEYLSSVKFGLTMSVYNELKEMMLEGYYRRAIKVIKKGRITKLNIVLFHNLLGLCYYGIKQKKKAVCEWRHALDIDKKNPQAMKYLKNYL